MIALLGMRELGAFCFSSICGLYTVWNDLFALPLGVFGRLYSVIVTNPGHLLYHSKSSITRTSITQLLWITRTRF